MCEKAIYIYLLHFYNVLVIVSLFFRYLHSYAPDIRGFMLLLEKDESNINHIP